MKEISKLAAFSLEEESVQSLLKAKKKVLKNFKISTDRSQQAILDLTSYLFVHERFDEIKEITELILQYGDIDSYILPYFHSYYIYIRKGENSDENLELVRQFFNGGDPGWPDSIQQYEEKLLQSKTTGDEKTILLGLFDLLRTAVLEHSFGDRSSFSRVFLDEIISNTLDEIQTILGIRK